MAAVGRSLIQHMHTPVDGGDGRKQAGAALDKVGEDKSEPMTARKQGGGVSCVWRGQGCIAACVCHTSSFGSGTGPKGTAHAPAASVWDGCCKLWSRLLSHNASCVNQ